MPGMRRITLLFVCLAAVGLARVRADDDPKQDAAATPAKATVTDRIQQLEEERELLQLFADTMEYIKSNYVQGDVTDRELVEAAIKGMLSKLDPYSNYIPPDEIDRFRTGVESEFGGVGIQVSEEDGQLRIISPIYGTPAYRAGLMAGDVIVEISGQDARGMRLDDAIKLVKGKIGSDVELSVVHPHDNSRQTVSLKRELIRLETVLGYRRGEDDSWQYFCDPDQKIAYLRITTFGRHSGEELQKTLEELKAADLKALVLDLRFNPGGLLSTAIEVCDMFISEGRIVSTEGRALPKRWWDAHKAGTFAEFPIAILVNRYSASASEIVAACLQDHERAVVVGERSWGKGSVQNVIELEEGRSAIKLTTASYLRPSGKNIHRFEGATDEDEWGVRPNDGYEVRFSQREMHEFNVHSRKLDILRPQDSSDAEKPFVDRQLEKALEYLRGALAPAEPAM